jgi:hypothetical protein
MKKLSSAGMVVMAGMALVLGGCAGSYQARNVDLKESVLVNPEILVKGSDDQALYRYVNPAVDIKKYTTIMIAPVQIRKDGELDKDELENYQKLANNAFVLLNQELVKDYKIVTEAEAGTMRLQVAITDADTSKPVRNTLSTIVPIGAGLSLIKLAAVGKQSGVGEISAEFKITDAMTGQLIGAALDRRVGGKKFTELWSSWYNANEALKYWAQQTRFALCTQTGRADCVKPEN